MQQSCRLATHPGNISRAEIVLLLRHRRPMTHAYIRASTIDDLIRDVLRSILDNGELVDASRGRNLEIAGVQLELTNPRARLSLTETRGKAFSALGELCWYLAESDHLDFIQYYLQHYSSNGGNGKVHSAYGPRLFNWHGLDQFSNVVELLKERRHSRRAVIQLFSAHDIVEHLDDVPCTCTLQFLIRNDALNLFVYMRSNDAYLGLTHDVFCFTMLQEITARTLGVSLGHYKHMVGSLHLYEDKREPATQFLEEGHQPTRIWMPKMPQGDPWPAIGWLLQQESEIRSGLVNEDKDFSEVEPYWADLARLLLVFRSYKARRREPILRLRREITADYYLAFVDRVLAQLQSRAGQIQ